MLTRPLATVAGAALLAATGVAGCSSSGAVSTNTACARLKSGLAALPAPKPKDVPELQTDLKALADNVESATENAGNDRLRKAGKQTVATIESMVEHVASTGAKGAPVSRDTAVTAVDSLRRFCPDLSLTFDRGTSATPASSTG